jgi:hypothetical protein
MIAIDEDFGHGVTKIISPENGCAQCRAPSGTCALREVHDRCFAPS